MSKSRVVPRGITFSVLLCLWVSGAVIAAEHVERTPKPNAPRVLIFTKMTGYVHASVPLCAKNIRPVLENNGFTVDVSDKSDPFTDNGLKPYRALVFLSNSGDLFTSNQRNALTRYIKNGGGFVGIHAVCTAEQNWSWFKSLVGSSFKSHPWVQKAALRVIDTAHPAVAGLSAQWTRSDEWYIHNESTPKHVHVLIEVGVTKWHGDSIIEQGTVAGPIPPVGSPETIIAPHPICWCHEYDGGRALYTAMGHFGEHFQEPEMQTHVLSAVRWAAHADTAFTATVKQAPATRVSLPVKETFVMAGATFALPGTYREKAALVTVYSIGGRVLRRSAVKGPVVDIKKDLGLPEGVYLARLKAR